MTVSRLTDLGDPAHCPLLVIKLGSSLLVGPDGEPREGWLAGLIAELAQLRRSGQQVVIVSSGAIALGAARLGLAQGGRGSLPEAQAAACVGQVELAGLYARLLGQNDLIAAQLLLTLGDLEDRRRYLNASATFQRLLALGAVPVVNENDSVATEEIRFGDNDRLAARVAQAAGADAVLLLSDVDGMFDRPPDRDGATLLRDVHAIDDDVRSGAGPSGDGPGTGGMEAKLAAADIATRSGIALAIANGTIDRPLQRALQSGIGTLFHPRTGESARKGWLAGRLAPAGTLIVDAGCEHALRGGASVLAAGIRIVEGEFRRGDLVRIAGEGGETLGQGLVEYDAAACRSIAGKRQETHEALLGHAPRGAVVHRDHLVML